MVGGDDPPKGGKSDRPSGAEGADDRNKPPTDDGNKAPAADDSGRRDSWGEASTQGAGQLPPTFRRPRPPTPQSSGPGGSAPEMPSQPPPPPTLPARYEDLGLIGKGATGEVRRVRDRHLNRVAAMKLLHAALVTQPRLTKRFLNEARITAELQHPGIVAVHDLGVLEDGRLWFTMREVRGRTLNDVLRAHFGERTSDANGATTGTPVWTFRRLVDAFARICQAVGYAHSLAIVHRDLKPDNLMVGEFGEVLVMDWGLGRHVNGAPSSKRDPDETLDAGEVSDATDSLDSFDMEEQFLTRVGDVIGTPAYMSPEQAMGRRDLHGRGSDVYSLGSILYHLLTGRPPFNGTPYNVIMQVQRGAPLPVTSVGPLGPSRPAELIAICERAMQREIAARYPDAGAMALDVLAWLDGARRREEALAVLGRVQPIEPEVAALRDRAASLRAEAQQALADVRPFDPIEKKRPGWHLEDDAADLEVQAAVRETEWLQGVHGALSVDPDLKEAHATLADHYRDRLAAAERSHSDEDAARFEALLRAHDRGRHAAVVRGEGFLTLVTDPPGADVILERYERQDRRLVPISMGHWGTTPLLKVPLQKGSYRLRIQAKGHAEVFYPVLIERGGHWDGVRPGAKEPFPIVLPKEGELGEDDCYVPAGWCWTGGDPEATDSLPARRIWVDAFVLARFPVTNGGYLGFLNDLVARGLLQDALNSCPKSGLGMGDSGSDRLMFAPNASGRFVMCDDELGRPPAMDWPVNLIDWFSAVAYAGWWAARHTSDWRLPHEIEREKAARGADGRLFPWGNHPDATYACESASREGEPGRASVLSFPIDEGPYGARGLAGNVRDWCFNEWRSEGPALARSVLQLDFATGKDVAFRAIRGGAWANSSTFSRAAARFGVRPGLRRTSTGFRLARSWDPAKRPPGG